MLEVSGYHGGRSDTSGIETNLLTVWSFVERVLVMKAININNYYVAMVFKNHLWLFFELLILCCADYI